MKRLSRCLLPFLLFPCLANAADADPSPPSDALASLIVPLLTVVFAVVALWWMWRRQSGKGGSAGPLRIVQVVAVGPRERVLVIDHDARRFMLGVTSATVTLLADLGPKDAVKLSSNTSASLNEDASPTPR